MAKMESYEMAIFYIFTNMGKKSRRMTKALIQKKVLFGKTFAGFLILENCKQYEKLHIDFFSILEKEGYM